MGIDLRIAMIGHKRFGSREGGVEVVVAELARRMAALGHEVTCYDRSGSDVMTGDAAETRERIVDGVRVVPVKTIDKKGLAAASASYYATKAAIADKPDVIHFHAEGPCTCLPMARRAGIRTVATIHGLDWQRAKWGKLGSAYIKHGEKAAAKCADEIIVLSRSAQDYFEQIYNRSTVFIPNGMNPKEYRPADEIEKRWGLEKNSYILFLGRLVPEKRPELLIEAFKELDTGKRLVIAGGASDTSEYEKQLEVLKDQKQALFERYLLGQIELDTYKSEKAVYDAEILKVKNAYAAVTTQAKLKREEQARQSSRQEIVHSIEEADVLTFELTDLLIEKVYVFPDNRIEIVYKVHDLFE